MSLDNKRGHESKYGAQARPSCANLSIVQALKDPALFGSVFGDLNTWRSWIVFLKSVFALPMDADEEELYRLHTGRQAPPESPAREAYAIVARRGGKSRIAALVAVYLAAFVLRRLAVGERQTVMVIASDRRQARNIFRYVVGLFDAIPILASLVSRRTSDAVELTNGTSIEIHTASYRTTRGYAVAAVVADEIAFWRDETSSNPDREILNALRPGMATTENPLLLAISSPYGKRGVLWETYRRYWGKPGEVLVWQASTLAMNPTIRPHVIESAYERDPVSADAEWAGKFRQDLESYVSLETVEACIVPGRRSLPPDTNITYRSFVDPSGGSRDSFTLAVAHRLGERVIVDLVLERIPPFSPEAVVREFSKYLTLYHVHRVVGDKYAAEWPREQFRKHGIVYDVAASPKSDLYRDFLPYLTSGTVELPENEKLKAQIANLERRTGRAGKDSIDHFPRAHDDLANAVAGVTVMEGYVVSIPPKSMMTRLWHRPAVYDMRSDHAVVTRGGKLLPNNDA